MPASSIPKVYSLELTEKEAKLTAACVAYATGTALGDSMAILLLPVIPMLYDDLTDQEREGFGKKMLAIS